MAVTFTGLVTQLPEDFYGFMLELQGKLAKMIKSVGKIDHSLYPLTVHLTYHSPVRLYLL